MKNLEKPVVLYTDDFRVQQAKSKLELAKNLIKPYVTDLKKMFPVLIPKAFDDFFNGNGNYCCGELKKIIKEKFEDSGLDRTQWQAEEEKSLISEFNQLHLDWAYKRSNQVGSDPITNYVKFLTLNEKQEIAIKQTEWNNFLSRFTNQITTEQGLQLFEKHKKAAEAIQDFLDSANELNINNLSTLFSISNGVVNPIRIVYDKFAS